MTWLTPPGKPSHGMQHTPVDLLASYDPPTVSGSGATSTTYGYNLDRQLESVLRPDGLAIGRTYDPATGKLASLALPTGTATYGYHPVTGKLASISGPYGVTLAYAYDGSLKTDETWSGAISGAVQTSYDNDFRVVNETVNGGHAVSFGYDTDGLLTTAGALTRAFDLATAQLASTTVGTVTEAYGYNAYGELESVTNPLLSVGYVRDALGRIVEKTETANGETQLYEYRYDLRGRLVEVKRDGVVVEAYAHDANGNRVGGTYDDQDRLLAYGTKTYSYTANGELASTSEGTQYTYDAQGALLSVELPDGRLIEYVIDGLGRRVGKKVDGVLQWGMLYRSALQPVAVLDGAGNVVDRYVYGSSRNVPEYLERAGTTYRILTDHLGSLRLVVNVATGEVVQRIAYDAYGRVLVDEVAAGWEPVVFGFAGGVYDRDTGLVRFGARDYDAEVGRWTAKDPIRFSGGDSNLYGYAGGEPVNWVDPDGTLPLQVATSPGSKYSALASLANSLGFSFGVTGNVSAGAPFGATGEAGAGYYLGSESLGRYRSGAVGPGFMPAFPTRPGSIGAGFQFCLTWNPSLFFGNGRAVGVNLPLCGADLLLTSDHDPFGICVSEGPTVGADVHYLITNTWTP